MRRFVFVLALCATTTAFAQHRPPPIDEAIARARREGKPLLVQFSTSWCVPCHVFVKSVLPRPEVAAALSDWIVVIYDAEETPGTEAAERYAPVGYPTFVILDGEGVEWGRLRGAVAADEFVAFLTEGRADALQERGIEERLATTPNDPRLLLQVARIHKSRGDLARALEHYDRAVAAEGDEDARADAAWEAAGIRRIDDRGRRAIQDATEFLRAYPRSPHAAKPLELLALLRKIEGDELVRLIDTQLEVHAEDLPSLRRLALVARSTGHHDRARAAAKRILALDPNDANARALADGKTTDAIDGDAKRMTLIANGALDGLEAHGYELRYGYDLPSSRPRDPYLEQGMGAARARFAVFGRVAAACGRHARGLREAWVRVVVPAEGGVPSEVVVLEPDAPWSLSRCLEEALSRARFPRPHDGEEAALTEPVIFGGSKTLRGSRGTRARTWIRAIGFADGLFSDEIEIVGAGASVAAAREPLVVSIAARAGATGEGGGSFGIEALVGAGFRRDRVMIGLRAGMAYDGVDGVVPYGVTLPIEAFLHVDRRAIGTFRVTPSLVEERKHGSDTGFLDETAFAIAVRAYGPIWIAGTMREQVGERFFGLSVGVGLER